MSSSAHRQRPNWQRLRLRRGIAHSRQPSFGRISWKRHSVNLVIFGASGGTGRLLVRQALAQNHTVAAFVRTPAEFGITHAGLRVVVGDVADGPTVARVVQGQDAVLSALGAATPFRRDPILGPAFATSWRR